VVLPDVLATDLRVVFGLTARVVEYAPVFVAFNGVKAARETLGVIDGHRLALTMTGHCGARSLVVVCGIDRYRGLVCW
jgi:hypothetical protein